MSQLRFDDWDDAPAAAGEAVRPGSSGVLSDDFKVAMHRIVELLRSEGDSLRAADGTIDKELVSGFANAYCLSFRWLPLT